MLTNRYKSPSKPWNDQCQVAKGGLCRHAVLGRWKDEQSAKMCKARPDLHNIHRLPQFPNNPEGFLYKFLYVLIRVAKLETNTDLLHLWHPRIISMQKCLVSVSPSTQQSSQPLLFVSFCGSRSVRVQGFRPMIGAGVMLVKSPPARSTHWKGNRLQQKVS